MIRSKVIFALFFLQLHLCSTENIYFNMNNIEIERLSSAGGIYKYNTEINLILRSEKSSFEFDQIKSMVLCFFKGYTYTPAMWELINKELVIYLSEVLPEIHSISSLIKIDANTRRPYNRWILTRLKNNNDIEESFGFEFTLNTRYNSLDLKNELKVSFEYVRGVTAKEYVDFIIIIDEIKKHFQNIEPSEENLIICQNQILQNHPSFTSFEISKLGSKIEVIDLLHN